MIEDLIRSLKPRVGGTVFIAIDGHGGAGKSALASLLSEKLHVEVIQTDDFATADNPYDWWPLVIEHVFRPIAGGAKSLSRFGTNPRDHQDSVSTVFQPVTPIMILEGVSSFRKEFRGLISLGIFVDTPKATCLERGLRRELGGSNRVEEITAKWEKWYEEEEKYMKRDRPEEYAGIILRGDRPFEDQLMK